VNIKTSQIKRRKNKNLQEPPGKAVFALCGRRATTLGSEDILGRYFRIAHWARVSLDVFLPGFCAYKNPTPDSVRGDSTCCNLLPKGSRADP
jgi:hypothetical protein